MSGNESLGAGTYKCHVYTHCVNGRVHFGRGVLVLASISWPRFEWVPNCEGSTSLSESLYLVRIDNGLETGHDMGWEENVFLVWYGGNAEMFNHRWGKGDVTMGGCVCLCNNPCGGYVSPTVRVLFIYLSINLSTIFT